MSIYSYLLSSFPTICVALMVLSLWSTSHYWRTLSVSWLATLSVGHYYLHYDEDLTTGQLIWSCSLSITLLMWSLLLTPFQLLLTAAEDRRPTAVSKVLWDPELFGVKKFAIKAEYVAPFMRATT
ncbi:hypothetical protein BDV97DRAFT_348629 [Delphinella strobiligena]|nr:hypothetical protein BDV97DRAFT_348629 [Delphinella strobiligena]